MINTDFGRKIKNIEMANKFSKLSNMKIAVVVFITANPKRAKRILF